MAVKSTVYFAPPDRAEAAVTGALEASGFLRSLKPKRKVGLKVHFGEHGNRSHLEPRFVRAAAMATSFYNLQPVAIETTALYRGRRQQAEEHIRLAREHGFGLSQILVPIDILDGQRGEKSYPVPLDSELVPVARLAQGLRRYHYIINMAHFKGHFVTGFGGVFKSLGMGLAAKAGKLEMHSSSKPSVNPDKCASCGDCIDYCPNDAINFDQYVARVGKGCTGCGGCLPVCRHGAIQVDWDAASDSVQRKMVEYARAVLIGRRAFHFDFCLKVTPNCDCNSQTEKPIVDDIGVFASADPVACDQAAYDRLSPELKKLYPQLKPETLLEAAAGLGLGSREYQLVEL